MKLKDLLMKILSFEWFKKIEDVVAITIVVAVSAIISGVVRILTTETIPLYGIRVYAPTITYQTYAEFIVVLVYYLLGTAGLLLYYLAARKRFSERGNRYAILGAALLIIFSITGLLTGMNEKI